MSTQHNNQREQGHGIRIITAALTGLFAGLTRAVADAVLRHLTTGN